MVVPLALLALSVFVALDRYGALSISPCDQAETRRRPFRPWLTLRD